MASVLKNILIIIPFFGETPKWICYFLKSCAANNQISWLLYGNLKIKTDIPENVNLVRATMEDFETLLALKLSQRFTVKHPYKICDFRPAFASVFSDYIEGYKFWGYGDLDLIYGNISDFIHNDHLLKYDVITTKETHYAGHFTLFRNSEVLNNAYRQIYRYKARLSDFNHHFCLDERFNYHGIRFGSRGFWERFFFPSKILRIITGIRYRINKRIPFQNDFTSVLDKMELSGKIKVLRLCSNLSDQRLLRKGHTCWKIKWKDGILSDAATNENILYFHFLITKNDQRFKIDSFREQSGFIISERGIKN